MTKLELLADVRARFSAAMDDRETDAEARELLMSALDCNATALYTRGDQPVPRDIAERTLALAEERLSGRPLAYCIGERWFMDMPFYTDERVLIPRQDTELLAETAIALINERGLRTALDLCTGSGCVAASLAKYAGIAVDAADISEGALAVAERNFAALGLSVRAFRSDMFSGVTKRYDIITINPPYITESEYAALDAEVLREPRGALIAGADGLDFYRLIARDAPAHLSGGGALALEIGCFQRESVSELLAKGGFHNIECRKDLCGKDRVVCCEYA